MQNDLERILFDEGAIRRRVDELAAKISIDYRHRELTVIGVLNGSLLFMADLLRRISLPLRYDCISVDSYYGGTKSTGQVTFNQVVFPEVKGRHLLLLDDVLDSGVTLAAIAEKLSAVQPESLKICVLLRKRKARLRKIDVDYVGFEIEDEFVVGYGLDYMDKYRNLPCIGILRKELIASA